MKNTLKTVLKGAAMGIAEVIPGVSGGTIAFITGIYERLLDAIKMINPSLLKTWKKEGFRAVLVKMDAFFLMKLFGGMVLGFVVGLKVIVSLLESHPVHIWSFFFGLIIASVPIVGKQVKKWGGLEIVMLVFGAALVYWITIAGPSQGSENLLIVFIAGIVGVSALMLPGLSGSFILLLMGMYTIIMPAISAFLDHPFGPETTMLVVFGLGLLVGLFSFARLLSYTFKKYPNPTLALLTGFLIGSLNKVWPWQEVLSTRINSKGEEVIKFSKSVLPETFSNLTNNFLYGNNAFLVQAIVVMVVAAVLVFLLDRFSPKEV
jgi:putative membrane protein